MQLRFRLDWFNIPDFDKLWHLTLQKLHEE